MNPIDKSILLLDAWLYMRKDEEISWIEFLDTFVGLMEKVS